MTITFDGKFLILLKRFSIKILDLDFPSLGLVTLKSEKALNSLIVPPQENYLVTSDIDGRIKFWYCLDSTWWQQRQKDLEVEREPRPISSPSKTWHWHAHSLSSLVFTSNSAYLISGGEEAVLVVWQVNSGRREYIPRLGSAIVSISLVPPSEIETISGQEVAVQMRDGTVLFVDTTNTKVTKAISGLKRCKFFIYAIATLCDLKLRHSVRAQIQVQATDAFSDTSRSSNSCPTLLASRLPPILFADFNFNLE